MNLSVLAQQTGELAGTIVDPQGAALSNNMVEVRWNDVNSDIHKRKPGLKKHTITTTDSAGRFVLNLHPGEYDVFAYRDGFAPVCTVVSIEPGETKTIELRFPALAPQRIVNQAK
jgi:hypothetical protein